MFIIAGIVLGKGNPYRLVYGSDSFGNICGFKNNDKLIDDYNSGLDLSARGDYLFYFAASGTIDHTSADLKLCVKSCPYFASSGLPNSISDASAAVANTAGFYVCASCPYDPVLSVYTACMTTATATPGVIDCHSVPISATETSNFCLNSNSVPFADI